MARYNASIGSEINAYKIVIMKPEEKRHLERSRRTWKDNVKTHHN